jgi:hypothetical protein
VEPSQWDSSLQNLFLLLLFCFYLASRLNVFLLGGVFHGRARLEESEGMEMALQDGAQAATVGLKKEANERVMRGNFNRAYQAFLPGPSNGQGWALGNEVPMAHCKI